MQGQGGSFDPHWKPYAPPDPNENASCADLLTDATKYCNRRMPPAYIREEMNRGAATIGEVKHIGSTVGQVSMEGGSVHQGGLALMQRALDAVALAAMRTALDEANAAPEALHAIKTLYFRVCKYVDETTDALDTRCLAIDIKDRGNLALKAGNYEEAIDLYTEAIELNPNYVYFANRSAAFLAIENYDSALLDANISIRTQPSYLKAYHRKACALKALGRTEEAASIAAIGLGYKEPWSGDTSGLETIKSECENQLAIAAAETAAANAEESCSRAEKMALKGLLGPAQVLCKDAIRMLRNTTHPDEAIISKLDALITKCEDLQFAAELDEGVQPWEQHKLNANQAFKGGDVTEAVRLYGECLRVMTLAQKRSENAGIVFSNRAACWQKLQQWSCMCEDCDEALSISPHSAKVLVRRGIAREQLGQIEGALDDMLLASNLQPSLRVAAEGKRRLQEKVMFTIGSCN